MAAFVYIMPSRRNGTIHLGSTGNLARRAWKHRNAVVAGFTKRHRCHLLVWYEVHETLEDVRLCERQMKEWRRAWKLRAIEGVNPEWEDQFDCVVHL